MLCLARGPVSRWLTAGRWSYNQVQLQHDHLHVHVLRLLETLKSASPDRPRHCTLGFQCHTSGPCTCSHACNNIGIRSWLAGKFAMPRFDTSMALHAAPFPPSLLWCDAEPLPKVLYISAALSPMTYASRCSVDWHHTRPTSTTCGMHSSPPARRRDCEAVRSALCSVDMDIHVDILTMARKS